MFDDAVFDLIETIVIFIENFLRFCEVALNTLCFAPRHGEHPINIVAAHIRFGAHRRHFLETRHFFVDLLPGFFRKLGLFDLFAHFSHLVRAVTAELCLNSLHLLIEIIFALGLLHLALHTPADFLLDLQHRGFAV